MLESVKVEQGDMLKFGRVRFQVKTLFVTNKLKQKQQVPNQLSQIHPERGEAGIHGRRNTVIPPIDEDMFNESQRIGTMHSTRMNTDMGMDAMIRMHSSANYSFDMMN